MSAAASRLELESPSAEHPNPFEDAGTSDSDAELLAKLSTITTPSSGPVIAVDLDDVLCQTNLAVSQWHNDVYGTNMDPSNFYYYYYWKNPFWGNLKDTFDKVTAFYETNRIFNSIPVPGAREGIQTLRDLGYKLIIVTARHQDVADESWLWVEKHFPKLFDSIICTGQFKDAVKPGHEIVTKLSKAQVCTDLNAQLLIDDSSENALQCATASPPTRVLLFGDYQWNQRVSKAEDQTEEMVFDKRLEAAGGVEFWKDEKLEVPEGAPIYRVNDWAEVVRWVKTARSEGKL